MAKVEITFEAPVQSAGGPLHNAYPSSSEILTSSGTTQTSTAAATHSGQTVSVTSNGGAVRITIGGGTLDAATGTFIVNDGQTKSYGGVAAGHRVAIIDLA